MSGVSPDLQLHTLRCGFAVVCMFDSDCIDAVDAIDVDRCQITDSTDALDIRFVDAQNQALWAPPGLFCPTDD